MTANEKTDIIWHRLKARDIDLSPAQATMLRRAEIALHRWAEQEYGDGNDYASWSIERDETNGKPYRVTYPHRGESYRTKIADKETAALLRVQRLCASLRAYYFHQTDPRGCALYVSTEPLTDTNYTNGVAICA